MIDIDWEKLGIVILIAFITILGCSGVLFAGYALWIALANAPILIGGLLGVFILLVVVLYFRFP
jgi:hypothetical protein